MSENTYTDLFIEYAGIHGKTPEQMLEHDLKRWPGGRMTGYILWRSNPTKFMADTQPGFFLHMSPAEASNQALAQALEWARGRGRIEQIAAALTEATGTPVKRHLVSRWLNANPEKRGTIGNFGLGLMLLHVVHMLRLAPEMGTAAHVPLTTAALEINLHSNQPEPARKRTKKTP